MDHNPGPPALSWAGFTSRKAESSAQSSCRGLASSRGFETKSHSRREMPLNFLHFWALWDHTNIKSDRVKWPNPDDGFPSCRTVIPVTCSFGASHTRYYCDLDNAYATSVLAYLTHARTLGLAHEMPSPDAFSWQWGEN